MNKVYVVYMANYEEVTRDGADATEILGVYKDRKKAYDVAKNQIYKALENDNWELDKENDNLDRDNFVRFFFIGGCDLCRGRENWDVYFELYVKECEVE